MEKFVKGPNPFEQPKIGTEIVPPYLRFHPGDEKNFGCLIPFILRTLYPLGLNLHI
jgi:hypothetical protein